MILTSYMSYSPDGVGMEGWRGGWGGGVEGGGRERWRDVWGAGMEAWRGMGGRRGGDGGGGAGGLPSKKRPLKKNEKMPFRAA